MSFNYVGTGYSRITTEPNIPEPLPINDENEDIPNRDFTRLIPISRPARTAFHNLVLTIDESP